MPDHGSDKKEEILDTALTLFTERGFFGTPTSLISKEAGVATGTLFFYFKTKEDLIDTLYRRTKSEAAKAMYLGLEDETGVEAKFHRLGFNAVDWGIRHPGEMKFMEQFAHSPFVSTTAQEEGMSHFLFLQDLVSEGIREGTIRNTDPSLLFCMMASALSGLIALISITEDPAAREEITRQGLNFIWNGLQAGSGKKRSRKPAGKK
jgi:AcrR family transcriptional regulator